MKKVLAIILSIIMIISSVAVFSISTTAATNVANITISGTEMEDTTISVPVGETFMCYYCMDVSDATSDMVYDKESSQGYISNFDATVFYSNNALVPQIHKNERDKIDTKYHFPVLSMSGPVYNMDATIEPKDVDPSKGMKSTDKDIIFNASSIGWDYCFDNPDAVLIQMPFKVEQAGDLFIDLKIRTMCALDVELTKIIDNREVDPLRKPDLMSKVLINCDCQLKCTATAQKSLNISWNKNNVDNFSLYYRRRNNDGTWPNEWKSPASWQHMTANSVNDTATPGYYYEYAIEGFSKEGKSILPKEVNTFVYSPMVNNIKAKNSVDGIKITWDPIPGVDAYRVYWKKPGGSWKAISKLADSSASFTDTGTSGVTYVYTVRGVDDAGNNITWYDTNGATIKYLKAPKITSYSVGDNKVTFNWGAVAGASKYNLYYKRNEADGSWTMGWKQVTTTSSTSYTDKSYKAGYKYRYTVRAIASDGKMSDYYDPDLEFTYYSVPQMQALKNNNTVGQIEINWSEVPGVKESEDVVYAVYYKRKDVSMGWKLIAKTKDLQYTDTGCAVGKTYQYAIQCYNTTTNKTVSGYQQKELTYKLGTPVMNDLQKTGVAGQISITWTPLVGMEKYANYTYAIYYKRLDKSAGWKLIGKTNGSSYTDTGCKAGYTYQYAVQCYDTSTGKTISSYQTKQMKY